MAVRGGSVVGQPGSRDSAKNVEALTGSGPGANAVRLIFVLSADQATREGLGRARSGEESHEKMQKREAKKREDGEALLPFPFPPTAGPRGGSMAVLICQ